MGGKFAVGSAIFTNYTQKQQLIRKLRIATLKPLTFGFVVAAVLCNYDRVMSTKGCAYAQTSNPQTLLPGRVEDTPGIPLPSDVLPDQPTLG
ncbi:hypothetical protein LC608_06230 [Nostoc sp. XA010]|uniref:hypothetical protein n=1 Tax=Nostoc sp. XA010 TaxID=2780407 RepID=UPI001E2EAC58|nr:hypothetical protein [Nostoc sp. XA010]MCC5656583.1 hypothetical protein [Nostoc sp. XA010]